LYLIFIILPVYTTFNILLIPFLPFPSSAQAQENQEGVIHRCQTHLWSSFPVHNNYYFLLTVSPAVTATTETSGNVIASSDLSTNPSASTTSKFAGDVKGAARGVAGSGQAALGTAIWNEKKANEGFEKMSAGKCI
jgi:hypothetical protein